jgi:transcriptional regulator with XRE-family HTH domain
MGGKPARPIDARIGANLRRAREQAGVSRARLGQLIDVTYQQIGKYENGTDKIGAGSLALLCAFLGVPVAEVYADLPLDAEFGLAETQQSPFIAVDMEIEVGRGIAACLLRIDDPARTSVINIFKHIGDTLAGRGSSS